MVDAARARPGPHSAALTGSGRSRARPEHGHSARPPVRRKLTCLETSPRPTDWCATACTHLPLLAKCQRTHPDSTCRTGLRSQPDFLHFPPTQHSRCVRDHAGQDTVRRRSSFIQRHLFIPAGMITKGRNVQRAHPVVWARETTSPLLPIRHRPTVSSRGHPRPPPSPPPGGWSRPSDDVGRGGPSLARARRRRRIPPPGGGHGQATTSDAAGPAGPARAAGGGAWASSSLLPPRVLQI